MSFLTVNPNAWTSVVTTTADTAFENRGARPLFITTEATGSLALDEGYTLHPFSGGIVISSGKNVSVSSPNGPGRLFYVEV